MIRSIYRIRSNIVPFIVRHGRVVVTTPRIAREEASHAGGVLSGAQVHQIVGSEFTGVAVRRLCRAGGLSHYAVGIVCSREGDGAGWVSQLADGAEGIGEEVIGGSAVSLRDAVKSVNVGVCAIAEGLGQAGVAVHGEGGG